MAARAAATGAESCVSCVSKLNDAASRTGSLGLKSQEADCVVLGIGSPSELRVYGEFRALISGGVLAASGVLAGVAQNAVAPRLQDQIPDSFLIERRPQLLKSLTRLHFSSAVKISQDDHQRFINRLSHGFGVGWFSGQSF